MSLKELSHEEIKGMSLIELAGLILKEEKKALHFNEIFDRISELREFSKKDKEKKMAQFYTDMNIDGRFTTIGSNIWGLRSWYPVEQQDEEVHAPVKKKKTSAKNKKTPIEKDVAFDDELGELDDEDDLDLDLEDGVIDDEDLDVEEEDLDNFIEDFDDEDLDDEE